MPLRADIGYCENNGCWNCAAMEDYAGHEDCSDYRCTDERCRPTKRHGCPSVAAGGFCVYYHKEP